MPNFCPKCGKSVNQGDVFCKNCGAAVSGPSSEMPSPTPALNVAPQAPAARPKPVIVQIISAALQLLIVGLFFYWVWYSYECATGKHPDSGDQMCRFFYQTFQNGGINIDGDNNRDNNTSIGCQHCQPGNCWVEGKCCPNTAQYYCNGGCYRTSNEAYNAGCHQSSWTRYCCQ